VTLSASAIEGVRMGEEIHLGGFEVSFGNLGAAKEFDADTIGLQLDEDEFDHRVKFTIGGALLCLERKGVVFGPRGDFELNRCFTEARAEIEPANSGFAGTG